MAVWSRETLRKAGGFAATKRKAETVPTAISSYATPKLSVRCDAATEHAGGRGGANCNFVKSSA